MKRVIDPETRLKLLGALPFNSSARHTFVPDSCKKMPEELQPTFTIRPFTRSESVKVRELFKELLKAKEEDLKEYARKVVIGWTNLVDLGSEEDIEFVASEEGMPSKELFEKLPISIVTNILLTTVRISGLMDIDKLGL